jgi:hypothetical protein
MTYTDIKDFNLIDSARLLGRNLKEYLGGRSTIGYLFDIVNWPRSDFYKALDRAVCLGLIKTDSTMLFRWFDCELYSPDTEAE